MDRTSDTIPKIAVLVTCYNRKEMTLRLLERLYEAIDRLEGPSFSIFLVDDKSPDGTGDAVRTAFPGVFVLEGTGDLFWNRGMCLAYSAAYERGPWSHYLLINDDLDLFPEDFRRLFHLHVGLNGTCRTITAGAVRNAAGRVSYSAFRRTSLLRPLGFERVPPAEEPQEVDTFNGNFVLIPGPVMEALNGFDPRYHHAYGDIDLGLRAQKIGARVILAPGFVGETENNPPVQAGKLRLGARFHRIFRSHRSVGQYAVFVSGHAPKVLVPLYIVYYVVRQLVRPNQ